MKLLVSITKLLFFTMIAGIASLFVNDNQNLFETPEVHADSPHGGGFSKGGSCGSCFSGDGGTCGSGDGCGANCGAEGGVGDGAGGDGDGDGDGCFPSDTNIATPSGEKAIGSLEVGDSVLSHKDGETTETKIAQVFIHDGENGPAHDYGESPLLQITLENGTTLSATANHPFFDPKTDAYKALGEFTEGDEVKTKDGETTILKIDALSDQPVVYNFETDDESHNYFAKGVLVHNKGCCCFIKGTLISTPSGLVAIEDLKNGDAVLSLRDGQIIETTVAHLIIHDGTDGNPHDYNTWPLLEITFSNNEVIRATSNHPFYDPKTDSYKAIGEFNEGDVVHTQDGETTISKVETLSDQPDVVYNLSIDDESHNFFAHGILVHNK